MRIVECYCPDCRMTYKIELDNDIPKYKHLHCIICGFENCSPTWIDRK